MTAPQHWHVADDGTLTVYRSGVPVAVVPPAETMRIAAAVVMAVARRR